MKIRRNGPRWNLIGRTVVLKHEVTGNNDELFKAGTRLRVNAEPLGRLAGDKFNAAAIEGPEFPPGGGAWKGVCGIGLEDFEVVGMPAFV